MIVRIESLQKILETTVQKGPSLVERITLTVTAGRATGSSFPIPAFVAELFELHKPVDGFLVANGF
jgi:hypothetical protein